MDDAAGPVPARRAATVELAGKTVLVTGASLGIGREIAFGFAAERTRLALTYLEHEAEARAVADRCRELGAPEVTLHRLDLGDEPSIRSCVAEVLDATGDLDILVDNAGVVVWRSLPRAELRGDRPAGPREPPGDHGADLAPAPERKSLPTPRRASARAEVTPTPGSAATRDSRVT